MHVIRVNGATSNILRVMLRNSSTGQGLTGLSTASTGLIISTIADTEASATAYTVAGSTIETITTLGTFATPTATKCRFKEVDATNHPGLYELQIADARFAVSSAKVLRITISGATNLLAKDVVVQLTSVNVDDAVRAGMTALPNVASGNSGAIPTVGTGTAQISLSSGQVILQAGTGTGQLDFTSGVVKANVTQLLGTAWLTPATAGTPDVNMKLVGGQTASASGTVTFPNATLASTTNITAGTITTTTNLTNLPAITAGWLTAAGIAADAITAAKIADGAIDRATFAADTGLQSVRSSTAQAGAAGTITLDASASATDNFYRGSVIYLTGGTGAGQYRIISGYVGSTKVATVKPAWTTTPDATSTFAVMPHGMVDVETILFTTSAGAAGYVGPDWSAVNAPTTTVNLSGTTIATTQKVDVETIKTNPVVNGGTVTFPANATLASTTNITAGTITTVTTATNVTTVNGLAAGVITASSIAADAITAAKIADGAIDRATFAADTGLQSVRSGTAQAGAAGTITLDASASSTTNFYNDMLVYITGGTGAGQSAYVSAYNGTTKVATVKPAWTTAPDNTSTFAILPDASIWHQVTADHVVSGSTGNSLNAAGSAGDPWSTSLPGAYGAGTAGYILGTNLNATVSSRLASASITLSGGAVTVGTNNDKTGYSLSQSFPTNFASLLINSSGHISRVTLADTVTTNTDMITAAGIRSAVGLSSANLDTQLDAIPTNADLATALAAADDAVLAAIAALNNLSAAQVNAEVVDALNVDTYAEPGQGAPAATTSLAAKINYLYKAWRNKKTQASDFLKLFADDGITVDQKAAASDDGTTTTIGEMAAGP